MPRCSFRAHDAEHDGLSRPNTASAPFLLSETSRTVLWGCLVGLNQPGGPCPRESDQLGVPPEALSVNAPRSWTRWATSSLTSQERHGVGSCSWSSRMPTMMASVWSSASPRRITGSVITGIVASTRARVCQVWPVPGLSCWRSHGSQIRHAPLYEHDVGHRGHPLNTSADRMQSHGSPARLAMLASRPRLPLDSGQMMY